MFGRVGKWQRSPHPARALNVNPAVARRRRSNLPRETTQGGVPAGQSKIELILGDCVVQENWQSDGNPYAGQSYNMYNAALRRWEQYWVDNKPRQYLFLRPTERLQLTTLFVFIRAVSRVAWLQVPAAISPPTTATPSPQRWMDIASSDKSSAWPSGSPLLSLRKYSTRISADCGRTAGTRCSAPAP